MPKNHTKYIFISGGVISGIGKGIAAASIGMILKKRGLKVDFIKCDPYINVDAGTMNPMEHGEVFVTDDGYEMDMDAGHYERFLDQSISRDSGITTGQIYLTVIQNERNLKYDGACVEVVPHIVYEIISRIKKKKRRKRRKKRKRNVVRKDQEGILDPLALLDLMELLALPGLV